MWGNYNFLLGKFAGNNKCQTLIIALMVQKSKDLIVFLEIKFWDMILK